MDIIYKATNLKSGRCYIGYTSKSLEERRRGHLGSTCSIFSRDLRLDPDNFYWEVLYTGTDARHRESEYILEHHGLLDDGGYNNTLKMSGGPKRIDKLSRWLRQLKQSTPLPPPPPRPTRKNRNNYKEKVAEFQKYIQQKDYRKQVQEERRKIDLILQGISNRQPSI